MILIFFLSSNSLFSQQLKSARGRVKSLDGLGLSNASILLHYSDRSDSLKTISQENGLFSFNNLTHSTFTIEITYVGFQKIIKSFDFSDKTDQVIIDDIVMYPSAGLMSNITLESQKIQIKEDTVSYKVDSTMYRKNDNVESLLKNLPGVQVDKDGTVTAQGKQVTKVKVNGKEFFNGDVSTATRELNADMVERIQIIDDYGDQAAFTGIKDGDPTKTMNIELKKEKNKGYFGTVSAGAGTEQRYLGSLSINKFNNNQQISLISNVNNTNASLFNFGSMGGSMGNMMNTMARSMGIGRGGAGVGSVIGNLGNNDGLNTISSVGVNYRDQWGSKIDVYGSYSFSSKKSDVSKESLQENISERSVNDYFQNSNTRALTDNHRVSLNLEYKIDSANYLKINPSLSYNKTLSNYNADFNSKMNEKILSKGIMFDTSSSNSPNLSGSLLYNHRFHRRGRFISFSVNMGNSTSLSDEIYDNITDNFSLFGGSNYYRQTQQLKQNNPNSSYSVKLSYTEPLSKKRSLELNYSFNHQNIATDRETFHVDTLTGKVTLLEASSNNYENIYNTHRIGINIKTNEKKYNYTIGVSAQPAIITTNFVTPLKPSVTRNLVNYYPVIRMAYNFSRSRSLNFNYNGSSSQPSISQLQEVPDSSNSQFISIGNPELRPEFSNTFSMRYNNFDFISGNVFFGNVSVSFTQDKIVNNIKTIKNVQETRYLNSDGYFTALGFYNVSRPIQNRKYVFNIGGSIAYNNNVSFLTDSANQIQKNIGKNWVIGQRFSTDFKIKKWLETTISVNYALNSSEYSLQNDLNSTTKTWTLSNTSRFFLPSDFIISYDIDKIINEGLATDISQNSCIINATLEKQFLTSKTLSLKLQAFDLLNQNINVARTVSSTGFTDTKTNRLGRYFMLSLVWRLNKFFGDVKAGGMMDTPPMHGGEMRMMRGGGF